MKYENYVLCGSEVQEHPYRRLFRTSSQGNLDCHLGLPGYDPEENLESVKREFENFLDEIFSNEVIPLNITNSSKKGKTLQKSLNSNLYHSN